MDLGEFLLAAEHFVTELSWVKNAKLPWCMPAASSHGLPAPFHKPASASQEAKSSSQFYQCKSTIAPLVLIYLRCYNGVDESTMYQRIGHCRKEILGEKADITMISQRLAAKQTWSECSSYRSCISQVRGEVSLLKDSLIILSEDMAMQYAARN